MRISWVTTATLLLSAGLSAQQGAQIIGVVKDSSEAVIPNATVTVINQATGIRRSSRSGPEGVYGIASLQPGIYKITARKDGFQTIARLGVRFEVAQNARVDFILPVGSTEQEVTVESGPAAVDLHDGSISMVIGRDLIGTLPMNGRGLVGLVELAPGVLVTPATAGEAGQFTTNGQRANTNYFTLDGVSANTGVSGAGMPAQFSGGSLPGMTAFGSTHNLISLEALEEFRIETSSFAPEFGRMPGAQVVASSRSGSNEVHGSIFESLRNQRLEANDWLSNARGLARGPLRFNDFGGVISGPVRRNRTFLFASYEGLRLRQPYVWMEAVPSLLVRQSSPGPVQPILNAFPLPTGRDLDGGLAELVASTSRTSRLDAGSLRLDHALTAHLSLFARYSRTPSATESGYSQINVSQFSSDNLTLGLTALFSPTLNNDLRLNTAHTTVDSRWRASNEGGAIPLDLSRLSLPIPALPEDSFYSLSVGGVGQIVNGSAGANSERQFNLVDTLSLTRGTHQIHFGGDYRRLAPRRGGPAYSVGITFETLDDLAANQNMLVTYSEAAQVSSVVRNFSLFLQDTWRIRPRLTLTFGSRWELNPPSASLRDAATGWPDSTATDSIETADRGASLWRMGYSNFGPRVGVAYGLTNSGHTVLRVGLGVYYDAGFSAEADAVNGAPFNSLRLSMGTPYGHAAASMGVPIRYGVAPGLRLPYSIQWNVTLEQALGSHGLGSLSYVTSSGHGLLRREAYLRSDIGAIDIAVATNHGAADYNALQFQYRRPMTRGLQGILSYNWSHSIDTVSCGSALQLVQAGFTSGDDRGSSSFDARHALSAAFTYDVPARRSALARGWALHGMFHARTGFPIDVLTRQDAFGLGLSNVVRPDLVAGVPLWVADSSVPGGRRLNRDAFSLPHGLVQGSLGRNAIEGFGMFQLDLAVRRQFHLSERLALDTRLEAFNALNHANFGDPTRFLASPLFGQPASMLNLMLGNGSPNSGLAPALQIGGPRSMQMSLRLRF